MKIENQLKHKVVVENELGNRIDFAIDPADMVQMARIGNIFEQFQKVNGIEFVESDDFQVTLKAINDFADELIELNKKIDLAFGEDITKKAFMGSSSLVMYNDFFEQLSTEMDKAGVKVKEYIKNVRQKSMLSDHKSSETI